MAQSGSLSAETETLSHVLSLVEAFRAFDSDNDGTITAQELGGILTSLGYKASEQDVRAMMQQGDTNKDGLLSLEEFLEMNTKDMELGGIANSLRTAFDSLNLDGDEIVTGEELHAAMGNIGVDLSIENCQNIIASMDGDGDGAVSFEDFQIIVSSFL
ncbi:hypothetical protein JRO89_XS07G0163900 [Xanthoceras sorbifolium]|uniref:EF-hand domain-containing protein n=1 Tax=Xanthoceras sorbifolium TaxID=99658 RepID=A0ABQ8HTZ2_9ROSI|nr:hypothetical protein JRO89_XS07G0163900 [Xanthoceras sorbifolium]